MKNAIKGLVVTGPSGVGKSTMIATLLAEYKTKFELTVSHTTRMSRSGEENGKHYHFISKQEFEKKIKENNFVEYNFHFENYYGTSIEDLNRIASMNKIPILDVDINGAIKIHSSSNYPCNFLFIMPPSLQALKERLLGRKTESDHSLNLRLKRAEEEIEAAKKSGIYSDEDYIIKRDWNSYIDFLNRIKFYYPQLK